MDRSTTYSGQLARTLDILTGGQNAMVGLAKLAEAVLGISTLVDGFTCTPTTPASLNVILTPGQVYQLENLEATTWSAVAADTAHSILKQGIMLDPATLGITPPGTVGYSQVFLIEVEYADSDTGSLVLPYYNAALPSSPLNGPGNAGTAQNTVRKGIVSYQVKAGTSATTGTQTTPTADAGWTGLFAVTVANGATTITSGNITQAPAAPFFPTLPAIPADVQSGEWTYGVDTGTANNYVVALNPVPSAYVAGMGIRVKMLNAPTGASVVNCNALGNKSIVKSGAAALTGSEWAAGDIVGFNFDGTNFQLASKRPDQGALGPVTRVLYITSTQTVTAAANEVAASIRCYGAGGGGGGGGTGGLASGGGGGEYAEGFFAITPGTAYTATVGAGGTGGTSAATNGAAGGTTSFGSLVTCFGGGGGFGASGVVQATAGAPGTGGAGGQLRFNGSSGSIGQFISSGVYLGSIGGYSYGLATVPFAFNVITSPIAGLAGSQPGNGGGGGIDVAAGGNGFSGAMIVTVYAA